MKRVICLMALMLLFTATGCTTRLVDVTAISTKTFAQLQEGVLLQADGKVIDIGTGHLVPVVTDWNDDGKKDLLIGQFSGGKIGLYLNAGTDSAPELKFEGYLEAGGVEISLPAG